MWIALQDTALLSTWPSRARDHLADASDTIKTAFPGRGAHSPDATLAWHQRRAMATGGGCVLGGDHSDGWILFRVYPFFGGRMREPQ